MHKLTAVLAAAFLAACNSTAIEETLGSGAGLAVTGIIPCSRDAQNSSCQFAVNREGDNAHVTVSWPGGEKRVIYFENGNAVRADAAAVFSTERIAGSSIVRIGSERYDIPDASVSG